MPATGLGREASSLLSVCPRAGWPGGVLSPADGSGLEGSLRDYYHEGSG